MKRRNNIDIMADILEISKAGAKKTWIVYRANLNFRIVKGYLDEMTDSGLLNFDEPLYVTTSQGLEFLDEYRNFKKVIKPLAQAI